jgi:hypothetical protein
MGLVFTALKTGGKVNVKRREKQPIRTPWDKENQ